VHLVLAVVPWHVLVTPSAAAGVLSAALAPDHEVTTYYANLKFAEHLLALSGTEADPDGELDADFLTLIADDGYVSGVAEWIFTQALYRRGEHDLAGIVPAAERLGASVAALRAAHHAAVEFTDDAAAEIIALQPDVVGLSTTFSQSVACVALANAIKALRPDLPVVLGGSNCDGPMGAALQRCFPFVDYVVRREGERPLRALLGTLDSTQRDDTLAAIPGLCWWQDGSQRVNPEPLSFPSGTELPVIDQTPYFEELDGSLLESHIEPQLIMESSRGCWWGERKHCRFCGLSDLTIGFRAKPGRTVSEELLSAARKHRVLDVMTSDNILEESYFDTVFPTLAEAGYDLDIFYELRVNLSAEQMRALRDGGVRHVQPGIENLHSAPLKLMEKGTTGAMNVAALRNFTENEISVGWNYLVGFPGESDEHYDEITVQLPRLVHLQPPNGAHRIMLERFNPYFERPELGFAKRAPVSWYRLVYPEIPDEDLEQLAYLFDADQLGISSAALGRLKDAIEAWKAQFHTSTLTHRDTGAELYIYDRRSNRAAGDYVLRDPLDVAGYRLLASPHSSARLHRDLVRDGWAVPAGWADDFLAALEQRELVFTESGLSVQLSLGYDIGRVQLPADPTSAAMASRT
jgi:ribosomal peptide maturation radical SAM protein 1